MYVIVEPESGAPKVVGGGGCGGDGGEFGVSVYFKRTIFLSL